MKAIDLVNSLAKVRILVVGDLMLDHYIWGDVQRISPEAPVPVLHVMKDTSTAGGAANVAANLAGLGVGTSVAGNIGADEAGIKLKDMLLESGVKQVLPDCPGTTTIIKTRVIARSQQLCRIDRESLRSSYELRNVEGFREILLAEVENVDAVIISDYAKGVINQELIDMIREAGTRSKPLLVAIDPKPSRKLEIGGLGLLTPNRSEALELSGIKGVQAQDEFPLEDVCRLINEKYHPKYLVVTLGADGMAVCENGAMVKHLPTEAREVFDVSGAGDTVICVLTAALAAGASLVEAASLANVAAGCVVAHMGTWPINRTELINRLQTKSISEHSSLSK